MKIQKPRSQPEDAPENPSSLLKVILRAPYLHRFHSKRLQKRRKPLAQWMRHRFHLLLCALLALLAPAPGNLRGSVGDRPLPAETLARLSFEQRLNNSLPLDAIFNDENGKPVRLADYFGTRPAILVLGYNSCPMLCSSVLNGLLKGLDDLKLTVGKDFSVLFVSIDPSETPGLASAKRKTYLRHYDRPGSESGWHSLTGAETSIRPLAAEAGFRYAYDPVARQYAHPSGLLVITPEGKISSYMFGVSFPAKDLDAALKAASARQISSPIQQLLLLCFHYNPITGKYGALIMNIVRVCGLATMLGLVWLIFFVGRKRAPMPVQQFGPRTPAGESAPAPP